MIFYQDIHGLVASIRYFILAALFMAMPSYADETDSRLLKCATRDTHFQIQLEHEQGHMPGEKLYAAYLTMLRARTACSAGRSEEGLLLYDSAFGPLRDTAATK
jgi:hypothetical protein